MAKPVPLAEAPPRVAAVRFFGPYRLLRLVGKSQRSMAWLAADPRAGRDVLLALHAAELTDAPACLLA